MTKLTPPEFKDYSEPVFQFGVRKGYDPNGWKVGKMFDKLSNFKSIIGHLARGFWGDPIDEESGLPHLYMAFTRTGMQIYDDEQHQVYKNIKKSFE